jgi:hypothetical protein
MTLVELGVAGLVSALVIGVMVMWASTVIRTETHLGSDDDAAQSLRIARENLGKDIRRAEAVFTAEDDVLEIWIDLDRDGTQTSGERIIWTIDEDGTLGRAAGDGAVRIDAEGLDTAASGFAYDGSTPSQVRNVSFTLVLPIEGVADAEDRAVTASIHIRNA